MTELPKRAQSQAEWAVETALENYLGYGLNGETCGEVVEAVVRALTAEGLILVHRDDLDAYLNRGDGANMRREVEALNRLRAALNDKEKPHA